MAGWQSPATIYTVRGGDTHPDSPEGRAEVWVRREDGYVVVMQYWRYEQMLKQAAMDGVPSPELISPEEAAPIVEEQELKNQERVNESNWQKFQEEAKRKTEAEHGSSAKIDELEARITAQDAKLDAILAALSK